MNASLAKVARHIHDRLGLYLDRQGRRHRHGPRPSAAAVSPPYAGEVESLAALLKGLGHPDPAEPLLMLETFLSSEEHLTASDFSQALKDREHDLSPEKAARALELFASLGFAEKHFTEDGRILYEHSRPGLHHDHIICSSCGRTTEFHRPDVDNLIEKIACEEDYCHLHHQLVIYGLCPVCRRRRHEGLPLSETKTNEIVVVVAFEGPEELKHRLADLGLRRNARLKILGEQSGSMIVLYDGCRLALGPELAAGVMVRAVGPGHCRGLRIPLAPRSGRLS